MGASFSREESLVMTSSSSSSFLFLICSFLLLFFIIFNVFNQSSKTVVAGQDVLNKLIDSPEALKAISDAVSTATLAKSLPIPI